MEDRIHVEESALAELKNALETAGEKYKEEYARLKNLIIDITNNDIEGEPAQDLLSKFKEKEEDFNKIATAIDEAEQFSGAKGKSFTEMLDELKARSQ